MITMHATYMLIGCERKICDAANVPSAHDDYGAEELLAT